MGTGNDGGYTWDVPSNQSPDTDYRVRVEQAGGAYADFSGVFTIRAQPVTGSASEANHDNVTISDDCSVATSAVTFSGLPQDAVVTGIDVEYYILHTCPNDLTIWMTIWGLTDLAI